MQVEVSNNRRAIRRLIAKAHANEGPKGKEEQDEEVKIIHDRKDVITKKKIINPISQRPRMESTPAKKKQSSAEERRRKKLFSDV